jgi:cytochrome c oxidase cbb3-type subunit 3
MANSSRDIIHRSPLLKLANLSLPVLSASLVVLAIATAANTAATQSTLPTIEEEYGEFLARPTELASVPVNDIAKSIRLNAGAMTFGKKVYESACAGCHGADLKGSSGLHTPDLTDADWRFSGDDLASGGNVKLPSDVEWTVRYGIRSGHPNARGLEADMLAYDPKYRTKDDIKEFGSGRFLTPEQVEDVTEYVLQISGQDADPARAARGDVLFHAGAKGNCFDCHGADGTGSDPIGSTNLTQSAYISTALTERQSCSQLTKGAAG